ncbi:MAG: hypothetical protein AB7N91_29785, partial [Candidatus Tectimicrobiota bacterium]
MRISLLSRLPGSRLAHAWQVLLGSLAGLLMAVLPCQAQTIQLKAWTIGPDDPSVYRATNLQTAAERLNAELAQSGASA